MITNYRNNNLTSQPGNPEFIVWMSSSISSNKHIYQNEDFETPHQEEFIEDL